MFPDPVIIPLDDLMDRLAMVPLDAVREMLASQGLHVITAEQKAVLDAMSQISDGGLLAAVMAASECDDPQVILYGLAVAAELELRKAKP